MNHRTLKPLLGDALDTLLSLKTSPTRHGIALSQIEAVVAPVALDRNLHLAHAFLTSQHSLEHNLTAGLLEWLGRTLVRFDSFKGSDADKVRDNMSRCLGLIQGLLLLHRPSQRLFARKSSLEYLVAVVELTRTNHTGATTTTATPSATPHASPHPSPVLFPTSPTFHPDAGPFRSAQLDAIASSTAQQQLALCALDTLLCALVDRPKNLRAFEESGGLESIVKVLKDRNVAQPVRIKIIEILYYYLLPETGLDTPSATTPSSTYSTGSSSTAAFAHSELPSMLATAATGFVPQTPTKPRPPHRPTSLSDYHDHRGARDRSEPSASAPSSTSSSRDPSPSRTAPQNRPPRGLRHKRSQSLLSFPTQPPAAGAFATTTSSRRTLSHSGSSAPTSDAESENSTPRPRPRDPVRSSRNPLEPIPGSPDLSSRPPRPQHHRRTQSTSSAAAAAASLVPPTPTAATAIRSRRGGGGGAETAMLPPPVPLSRSTSTRLAPSSSSHHHHRRTLSSSSSASTAELERSSSLSSASTPRPRPATSTRDSHDVVQMATRHVRTEGEKKELLRALMPNVDALEQRFKMMGLGGIGN
ncbi:hypothetical protein JCM11491_004585 [Sporobolomyces phaffii]